MPNTPLMPATKAWLILWPDMRQVLQNRITSDMADGYGHTVSGAYSGVLPVKDYPEY